MMLIMHLLPVLLIVLSLGTIGYNVCCHGRVFLDLLGRELSVACWWLRGFFRLLSLTGIYIAEIVLNKPQNRSAHIVWSFIYLQWLTEILMHCVLNNATINIQNFGNGHQSHSLNNIKSSTFKHRSILHQDSHNNIKHFN